MKAERWSMHWELTDGDVVLYFSDRWPAQFAGAVVWPAVEGPIGPDIQPLPRNWIAV